MSITLELETLRVENAKLKQSLTQTLAATTAMETSHKLILAMYERDIEVMSTSQRNWHADQQHWLRELEQIETIARHKTALQVVESGDEAM